ncbi:MAG: hypothetical protein EBV02_03945 [Actinobacteria bacterium]|nr:hypothetical protein [Actinomycetota bacterium]
MDITIDNTAAFLWNDHEVFAKWFADTDAIEVLVVVMPADPAADHFDFVVDTEAAAPDGFEVEIIFELAEQPIIVALNYPQAPHANDEAINADLDTLFEIAGRVVQQVC